MSSPSLPLPAAFLSPLPGCVTCSLNQVNSEPWWLTVCILVSVLYVWGVLQGATRFVLQVPRQ